MATSFRIGLVQMSCSPDAGANLSKAESLVRQAAGRGARIVCLPELFRHQYFCREENPANFDLAEPVPGPSTDALGKVACELGVAIVAPLFERRAAGLYHNTAAVIAPDGSIAGVYRKMHVPHDPLYFEKYYFAPGDQGFTAIDTPFGRIAVLVCWDQWYPEGARIAALSGASVLFYPTAIGWHPSEKAAWGDAQLDAWRTVQRAHAIANGVYVAAVNRTGREQPPRGAGDLVACQPAGPLDAGLEFWGSSFVADPFGRVLAQAGTESEEVLIAECDPARLDQIRRNWPFLRDRRIDAYGPILHRWLDS
jgi:N-carbamoylputrescine amidase